ncbi:hypothetical protein [Streptomyces sp. NBC_00847]|uniref:hypothetical protein n=1 Tax=Streptomyces sp. NBC_00847 TaxID=2975850 RepID=UPI00225E20DB|nr:hypothetical protein [Streptomyces sp. NBC_00847]MCX4885879.1 hypothetical protein [Streptomyces sp. NBC_00847]
MSNLPERYQPYATPAGQPTPARDLVIHQPQPIQPHYDRHPVVYIPSAENPNVMVAVERRYVEVMQPTPARDLTPQPLFDPGAQKILASGIGVGAAGAGIGYGAGQMFAGIALMGTSGFMILLGLILAGAVRGTRGNTHIHKTTNVHQKWFGKTGIHN